MPKDSHLFQAGPGIYELGSANPKSVSVILPCFNAEKTLVQALESALAQELRPTEIVAVDDGSSDGTREILQSYSHKYPGTIRVLYQDRKGPYVARNRAAFTAKGTWLAFLDSDDQWEPEKLVSQLQLMEAHPDAVLCHTGAFVTDAAGRVIHTLEVDSAFEGDCFERLLESNGIAASTVLIPRSVFEELGGFDESFPARGDWELWTRISRMGRVVAVREPLMRYRLHEGNMSRQTDRMRHFHFQIIEKNARTYGNLMRGVPHAIKRARFSAYLQYGHDYLEAREHRKAARDALLAAATRPWDSRPWKLLIKAVIGRPRPSRNREEPPAVPPGPK